MGPGTQSFPVSPASALWSPGWPRPVAPGAGPGAAERVGHLLALRRSALERSEHFRPPWPQGLLRRVRGARRRTSRFLYAQRVRVLELATRVLGVERVVIDAPEFRGVFELALRSHLTRALLLGSFVRTLLPLLQAALGENGGDVVDVGASVGLYTVLGARLTGPPREDGGGRVLAIEPAPPVLPLLRANVERNGLPNVVVFAGAAADAPGTGLLHFTPGNEEYASLGGLTHPFAPRAGAETVPVPTETLDRLVARHGLRPVVMKIDAEGAEGLVLSGAGAVLGRHRPVILSELDDRLLRNLSWSAGEVRALLRRSGYRVFDADTGMELEEAEATAEGAEYIGEIVALPE